MQNPLSAADVPSQFLQAAFLVGQIPLKASKADPRVSYALYIPPTHYDTDPQKKLPLLVCIHGTGRNSGALHREEMISFANSTPCAILAPLFPAGLDGPNDLDSYKMLRSKSLASDLVLLSILDEVAVRWPGIQADKVFMMGFSGGGQFAQRFLYIYPERLLALSVGAPGRVTMLDHVHPWPVGVANVEALFSRPIRKHNIQQIPIQLAVGSADNQLHGGEDFWKWLQQFKGMEKGRQGSELQAMGKGRSETLQNLHKAWEKEYIPSQLDIVEGASHEGGKIWPHMMKFLRPLIQAAFHDHE
ncbi:hypothetical protein N7520_007689 [Penicillium odoratum]|uniref:uncharacterized protein n=1 Tax=Penicillium odoratum TaxID=1167516 RepID=UPI0025466A0F|nr:uncharacterized protein N7520_007689 [Penicillium odoratum]KAJ5760533.1 hypothetical protein N7520_007689 [Penicillium odoratum]